MFTNYVPVSVRVPSAHSLLLITSENVMLMNTCAWIQAKRSSLHDQLVFVLMPIPSLLLLDYNYSNYISSIANTLRRWKEGGGGGNKMARSLLSRVMPL